jgi:hypothetical protein
MGGAMLLSAARFEMVFRKIKQIKEHRNAYCIAPDRAKMSVEDLQWCIADIYGLKIEKKEVAFDSMFLLGMVERYADRARILLRKDQPEDSMRFVTTKELCQLAIDEPEDWSPRGTETLDAYMNELRLDLGAAGGSQELAPNVAQVGAPRVPRRDRISVSVRIPNSRRGPSEGRENDPKDHRSSLPRS